MAKSNKATLLRKYKNLSRVLTTTNNMEITFSGNGAYHLPGRINLPYGDFSDDDFVTMSMGFCDHELGHENYTDSNWYHLASDRSAFLKGLLNALDDYHQERRLMADFRGTKISLRKLVELCKVKGLFGVIEDDSPIPAYIHGWVLYKARSHLGQPLSDLFNVTDKQVLTIFGEKFYADLHSLLSPQILDGLVSTERCFVAAEKIFELLLEWMKDNQEPKDSDDSDSDDSDSDDSNSDDSNSDDSDSDDSDSDDSNSDDSDSDDSDSDDSNSDDSDSDDSDSDDSNSDDSDSDDSNSDDSDSDDSNSDDSDSDDSNSDDSNSDDSNSDDSNSDDSDSDDSDSDDSDSDDSNSDDSDSDDSDSDDSNSDDSDSDDSDSQDSSNAENGTSNNTSNEPDEPKLNEEQIEKILQVLDDYEDDFHEKLIQEINSLAEGGSDGYIPSLSITKRAIDTPMSKHRLVDDDLRGVISKLKNPLKRFFHDQNFVNHSLHNRGKSINSSRLAGVAIGNTKVFDSQTIHRSPNAAIALLIDKSGSMSDEDMTMANSVAYSLSTALDGIHGVESLVGYYPVIGNQEDMLGIVKSFEEKKSAQGFNIDSYGTTPTADAITSATSLLMSRGEPRKLLFVITDGSPDNVALTEKAIEEATALGVKVFGIGIRGYVRGFSEADFHVIYSTKDLVNALTVGLKHAFK
ncbi:hypothetical protein GCM10009347_38710 [Shewanella algicola]|uniref:VWFA domain-containing protein n=1 Tax=Shewanella algicola TaxID=640633 RepID=A0A9X1Z9J8_9GAMM|nr:hypothetical protein [Shewanella algicola]MCL1107512.1 hypothetical protein [Shewanella algicola]GGP69764.1 hypothetical protein GCM10009347_38710 [Shewanella algicola]